MQPEQHTLIQFSFHVVLCVFLPLQSASSGRMVELMGGELGAGVIGFESVSSGLLPTGGTALGSEGGATNASSDAGARGGGGGGGEEVNIGAGTKFQVVMKQLGKKDTTTKLKVCGEKEIQHRFWKLL